MTGTALTIASPPSRNQAVTLRQLTLKDLRDARAFIIQALQRISGCTDLSISRHLQYVDEQVKLIEASLLSGEYEDMP